MRIATPGEGSGTLWSGLLDEETGGFEAGIVPRRAMARPKMIM